MAGNEWINGYLNAFLHTNHSARNKHLERSSSKQVTKYFVEEVVNKFDEADIHRSWAKATVTRNDKMESTRFENLCWRIWHEQRRRKQAELEQEQQRLELHRGHQDAREELLEDLSEGEKQDVMESSRKISRNLSAIQPWSEQEQTRRMYIVLISLHGLVRGENMELGRDSDTGGQVKYVVELAKTLATMPGVCRVDLLTRQICAADVDWSYGEPTEMLVSSYNTTGIESSGAYIVRIPCGPRHEYFRKELLWPFIEEFVDGALCHIHNMAKVLADQISEAHGGGSSRELVWPQVVHGHYADAGLAASLISGTLNVPMVMTGHSLGRSKLQQLLVNGRQSKEDVNSVYKILRRIEAEETCLDGAEIVITSTKQESIEQWGDQYFGYDVRVDRVLRVRAKRGLNCHGRYMPRMVVIPPGMDFSNVVLDSETAEVAKQVRNGARTVIRTTSSQYDPQIWKEIMRFFTNPHKPMILALARPDPKKNITALLKAYGECSSLRELANLTLIMGNRDDIDNMSPTNASVLTSVLKLIDKYDLHGQVSYPKHHTQADVPAIYQLAAKTKGVFINPALVEPFGLTLIEAAAYGLPIVATNNGGPVDIQQALQNGLLVDPRDDKAIARALLNLVSDRSLWLECQRNGLKNISIYSWPEHCRTYLSRIVTTCKSRHPQWTTSESPDNDTDSLCGSLRDLHDLSLRLSVDGEKIQSFELFEKSLGGNGKGSITTEDIRRYFEKYAQKKRLHGLHGLHEETGATEGLAKRASLRSRKYLFVFAVDNVESFDLLKEVVKAGRAYGEANQTGVAVSTSLTGSELSAGLKAAGISTQELDVVICSSGSELYYPSSSSDESSTEHQLSKDTDYEKHIEFRWDVDGMEKTLAKLFELQNGISRDSKHSNSRCLAYQLASDVSTVMKPEELHEKLRMRGLRCHIVTCQNGSRLYVLPLFASRWLALRYLFIRWGVEIPNMFVLVGESGDSDHDQLLRGLHKTVTLKQDQTTGTELGSFGVHAHVSSSEELLGAVSKLVSPKSE